MIINLFVGRTCYLITDTVYVKFVTRNLKSLNLRHVCL